MNQQCKVCGEPAAGFHFGAFTCEGCKSFFGRTYNNLSSISECKNNGECVINKKNRTACKACRLRKCLMVGMSKSGSRYGRRSNWFKIHCLLQEQQQAQQLPSIPHLYPAGFLPNHLLGLCSSKQENRTSSPSDSGASSADPEEDGSLGSYKDYSNHQSKDNSNNHQNPSHPRKEYSHQSKEYNNQHREYSQLNKDYSHQHKEYSQLTKDYSNQSTEYSDRSIVCRNDYVRGGVLSNPSACLPEQEEPIDLSIRPRDTTMPEVFKSAPLDLTLVAQRTSIVQPSG